MMSKFDLDTVLTNEMNNAGDISQLPHIQEKLAENSNIYILCNEVDGTFIRVSSHTAEELGFTDETEPDDLFSPFHGYPKLRVLEEEYSNEMFLIKRNWFMIMFGCM